jgi:carboxyl-terminal processing protease
VPNNSSEAFGVKVTGCVAADDYNKELGDETEGLLATALAYRDTGSCPAVAPKSALQVAAQKFQGENLGELATTADSQVDELYESNRDMRKPF